MHPPALELIQDPLINGRILALRQAVAPILGNNLLPYMTDHTVEHSDNLVDIVDRLIAPLQRDAPRALNTKELSVLYAACYLHDVGMQYEQAGASPTLRGVHLPQPWEDLSAETRAAVLREHHAAISADLIALSISNQSPPLGLQFGDEYEPSLVARLCKCHTAQAHSDEYAELVREAPNVRMPLLAGLLRVADILDESRRRALSQKRDSLCLSVESQAHWYRHHYTKEIEFLEHERLVRVWFDFPPDRFEEYSEIVPLLQMPAIEQELANHQRVFSKAGIPWSVVAEMERTSISTAKVMPDPVVLYMLQELKARHEDVARVKREAALCAFCEARPYVNRRIAQLEDPALQNDVARLVRETIGVVQELRSIGALRSAWNVLNSRFVKIRMSPDRDRVVDVGLLLAELAYDCGFVDSARSTLQGIHNAVEALGDGDARKLTYWRLISDFCLENFKLADFEHAVNRRIALTTDSECRRSCKMELAQHFLDYGEFDKALQLLVESIDVP